MLRTPGNNGRDQSTVSGMFNYKNNLQSNMLNMNLNIRTSMQSSENDGVFNQNAHKFKDEMNSVLDNLEFRSLQSSQHEIAFDVRDNESD